MGRDFCVKLHSEGLLFSGRVASPSATALGQLGEKTIQGYPTLRLNAFFSGFLSAARAL